MSEIKHVYWDEDGAFVEADISPAEFYGMPEHAPNATGTKEGSTDHSPDSRAEAQS